MSIKGIAKLLELHDIFYELESGRIIAIINVMTRNGRRYERRIDLTDKSRMQLLYLLGHKSYEI